MNDTLHSARLDQILETRNRQVIVDSSSCSIVADLKSIDPSLEVRFVDSAEPYFAIVQNIDHRDGRKEQHLVTTVLAEQTSFGSYAGLDQRIVERVRKITHPSYDFGSEALAIKTEHDNEARRKREDLYGDIGERAAFELRKDLGSTSKAFIK